MKRTFTTIIASIVLLLAAAGNALAQGKYSFSVNDHWSIVNNELRYDGRKEKSGDSINMYGVPLGGVSFPASFPDFSATIQLRLDYDMKTSNVGTALTPVGIVFRQDEKSGYIFGFNEVGLFFFKAETGVEKVKHEVIEVLDPSPLGRFHELKVICRGASIRCYYDGKEKVNLTDTLPGYVGNNHLGIGSGEGMPCTFKDFQLTTYSLWEEVKKGNAAEVKSLINKNNLNTGDENFSTPLMYAALKGNTGIMKILLEAGADANQYGKDGTTPLLCACYAKSNAAVILLLDNKADPNGKDLKGTTALIYTAGQGLMDACKTLIAAKADMNQPNAQGVTALMFAAAGGQTEAVKLLLAAGADPNVKDLSGNNAAAYAASGKHPELAELLTKSGSASKQDPAQFVEADGLGAVQTAEAVRDANKNVYRYEIYGIARLRPGVDDPAVAAEWAYLMAWASSPRPGSKVLSKDKGVIELIGSKDVSDEGLADLAFNIVKIESAKTSTRTAAGISYVLVALKLSVSPDEAPEILDRIGSGSVLHYKTLTEGLSRHRQNRAGASSGSARASNDRLFLIDRWFWEGTLLHYRGDTDNAIRTYGKAIALNPDRREQSPVYVSRGLLYLVKEANGEALKDLNQAIRLDANNLDAYLWRGAAFVRLDQYEAALTDWNKLVAGAPRFVNGYVNRSDTFNKLGRYDEALADCAKGFALDPKNAYLFCNRADAEYGKGQYQDALADYRKSIDGDPSMYDSFWGLALTYEKFGKPAEARDMYKKFIKIAPQSDRRLGEAKKKAGR